MIKHNRIRATFERYAPGGRVQQIVIVFKCYSSGYDKSWELLHQLPQSATSPGWSSWVHKSLQPESDTLCQTLFLCP